MIAVRAIRMAKISMYSNWGRLKCHAKMFQPHQMNAAVMNHVTILPTTVPNTCAAVMFLNSFIVINPFRFFIS